MESLRSATSNRLVIVIFFLILLLILYFYYTKNSDKVPNDYQFITGQDNSNSVNINNNNNNIVIPPKPRVDAVTGSLFKSNIKRKSHLQDNHIQELLKVKRKSTDSPCHVPMMGVVTTLKNGNQCLKEIANLMDLIVVGDAGSPDVFTFADNEPVSHSVDFLSIEKQNALYPEISRLLPTNHFARKNIGFIHAMNKGACLVYDFDDDNYLTSFTAQLLTDIGNVGLIPNSTLFLTSKDKVVNPYPLYGPPSYIWPRGFPLELIHKREFPTLKKNEFGVIDVVQIMQDIDPDVDANWRLEYSKYLPMGWLFWDDVKYELFKIDPNRWTPYNAQATLLSGRIARFAMLPHTVHGRVSDIWRSYIMQYIMKLFSNPGVVSFSGMAVEHRRNSHAYMADRDAEDQLIKQVHSLVEYLDEKVNKRLKEKNINIEEEYINLIDDLYMRGYLEKEDVELAVLWQLAITERPYVGQQTNNYQPIPTIFEKDPFLNVTVVLHLNFGHLPAIPMWMAIYGHYFNNIRVYSPGAPGCMQISGITVYCIDKDFTGVLSYHSTLHTILSVFNIQFRHDVWPPASSILSMNPELFTDDGILFIHDDMFIKKSEIPFLGGDVSYQMTDEAWPIERAEATYWGWLNSDIYGRPTMDIFRRLLNLESVSFFYGQSDGYYLAKKDMLAFAQYGYVAFESKMFLEITIPTLYMSFLNATSKKWTYTTFESFRYDSFRNVGLACSDENIKAVHPVKLSFGDGFHAHFLC